MPGAGSGLRAQALSLAAAGVILGVIPLFPVTNHLLQLLTIAFLFAVPAVGLGLLYGEAGQMSVASGALFGVGAYIAAIGAREHVLTLSWSIPLGALGAAFAATLVGLTALRVRGHYFLIVTFAFAELWRISTVNIKTVTGGNQGVMVLEPAVVPLIGEIESLRGFYYFALACVVIGAVIVLVLRGSAFGRSLRVVRENERLAISLGLNAARARLIAFAVSGALAGAAGVVYAYDLKHIGPDLFGAHVGIQMVLILLIGGARSAIGPLVGSMVFFAVPEVINVDPVTTQILYGIVLIAIVLISPEGLAPGLSGWLGRGVRRATGRRVLDGSDDDVIDPVDPPDPSRRAGDRPGSSGAPSPVDPTGC